MQEKLNTMSSLVQVLQTRAEEQKDKVGFYFLEDGESKQHGMTYGELDQQARAIGAWLQQHHAAGERVILLFPTGLDYLAAFFGCLYAGAVAVPAYPPSSKRLMPRLQGMIEDAKAAVVLTTSKVKSKLKQDVLPSLHATDLNWLLLDEIPDRIEEDWNHPQVHRETTAFFQYTSGSTSTPKGVVVTHGNLLHNLTLIHEAFRTTEEDRSVIWLPPYHDMGLIGGLLQPLAVGFTVTIFSAIDFMQRPLRWLEAISNSKATISGGPNFAYDLLVERTTPQEREQLDLSHWRVAFNGAEPIHAESIRDFSEAFACAGFHQSAFFPCYGLAETTLFVSGTPASGFPEMKTFSASDLEQGKVSMLVSEEEQGKEIVSCGGIPSGHKVEIVNPHTLQRCAAHEIGEIWVSSDSVAKAYWNRQEATIQTFKATLQDGEAHYLRTGDLGFVMDGHLYVTGRVKDLIIIRGRNHYPQDIELTAEKSHEALRKGACAAFSISVDGEERFIVAIEVDRHFRKIDVSEISRTVRQAVAEHHEVQVYGVLLLKFGSIPKTSSGKIQRHACRDQYVNEQLMLKGSDVLQIESLQGNEVEQAILTEQQVIDLPESKRPPLVQHYVKHQLATYMKVSPQSIDDTHPLHHWGMDSLVSTQLQTQIESDLGVVFEPSYLLEGPNVRTLTEKIIQQIIDNEKTQVLSLNQMDETSAFPMSQGQQALWFLYKQYPESTAYHVAKAFKMEGPLDMEAMRQSFDQLIKRHSILRTVFYEKNGELLQHVIEDIACGFEVIDAATWSETELTQQLTEQAKRPFVLEQGDTMRVYIYAQSHNKYTMLWAFHHMVIDYWSLDVLFNDLSHVYRSVKREEESGLTAISLSFASYVDWQNKWMKSDEGKTAMQYWEQELAGERTMLELPLDYPRPSVQRFKGAVSQLRINKQVTDKLKLLSQQNDVTLFHTLLAAYGTLLYRYTQQSDFIVGTYMAGRTRAALEHIVGYMTNAVPIRFEMEKETTFQQCLQNLNKKTLAAYNYQNVPFDALVKIAQPERDASYSPLFQTAFVMQNIGKFQKTLAPFTVDCEFAEVDVEELTLQSVPIDMDASQFDLTLMAAESNGEVVINFHYNTDLFASDSIKRMTTHYETLLAELAHSFQHVVQRVNILPAEEIKQVEQCSSAKASYEVELTLSQQFELQVKAFPARTAVIYEQQRWTYTQLNEKANQLAHVLKHNGVKSGSLVGISMERSPDIVVAILALYKVGAAYVAFDPTYPDERLQYILDDSNITLMLTHEQSRERCSSLPVEILCLDRDVELLESQEKENINHSLQPNDLAYVIYTSGSTGKPKGVMVNHHNVGRLFKACSANMNYSEEDIWSMFHSYAFDFSVFEMWGALLHGGALLIVPHHVSREPEQFYNLIQAEKVTVLSQTPSAFSQLIHIQSHAEQRLPLRYVVFGGEKLDFPMLQPWFHQYGDQHPTLINMYGITETTVHTTFYPITAADVHHTVSNIGRPLPDLHVLIMDQHSNLMPLGMKGEMLVGGAGVAQGYLNRPDLTKQRFIEKNGMKYYRSGDVARYLADGNLSYLGRMDDQVKIRGFRIELGEIAAVLKQYPAVREQVVTVREIADGSNRLIAFIVPEDHSSFSMNALRDHLHEKLPEYMVPSIMKTIDSIPLTINGKIDYKLLPDMDLFSIERTSYEPPTTWKEEILVMIWEQVLDVKGISIDDNFFVIGGDSIRSIKVSSLAKEKGMQISLEDIFQHQSIRQLARVVGDSDVQALDQQPLTPFALVSEEDRLQIADHILDAYPIPAIQMSFYFHSESSSHYKAYIESFKVKGILDEERFNEAIRRAVKRHDILRTSFDVSSYSEPLLLVHPHSTITLHIVDIRHLTETEQQASLTTFLHENERARFHWEKPGLCRFHAHRLTDDIFQITMCEPLLDGWSAATLLSEVLTSYSELLKDEHTPEWPPLQAKFSRYIQLERETTASPTSQQFWENKLHDVAATKVPRWERAEEDKSTLMQDRMHVTISEQLSAQLIAMSKQLAVPLKDMVLAAHMKVVSVLSGQTDVVTGVVTGGRPEEKDAEKVLGSMVNTMPVRMDITGATWEQLIQKTFEAERESYPHRRFPLVELQRQYSGGGRMFETIFNYTHFHVYQQSIHASEIEILDGWHQESAYVPLTTQFSVNPQTSTLMCVLDFYPEDLSLQQVEQIGQYYVHTLQQMVDTPYDQHEQHSILSSQEWNSLIGSSAIEWNDFPVNQCYHHLFEQQAEKTPNAIAILDKDESITYGDLSRRSNQLAQHLQHIGVQKGAFIGYFGERNMEWAIAMLAIFKIGAVYIPLDPKYPEDRLKYMVEHAEMSALITYDRLQHRIAVPGLQKVLLDQDENTFASYPIEMPQIEICADDLAYVIYTSGSTGKPKGAMIEHKGFVNHIYAKLEVLQAGEHDIVAQNASQCFDVSVWQLLMALVVGGKSYILPDEAETEPSLLLQEMDAAQLCILESVPTVLQAMMDAIDLDQSVKPAFDKLRYLVVSGEALSPSLTRQWFHHYHIPVINACGATECSDDVTHQIINEAPHEEVKVMPIGQVIPNSKLYVLDTALKPVPIGVPGELCYGGVCVGRGYLHDEEKTAKAFVKDPFIDDPNARLYRSGDMVRLRHDGYLEFLGRMDHQVKIRGFRVELGEIENVLNQHPAIQQVIVKDYTDEQGTKRLVAYFTIHTDTDTTITVNDWKAYMKKQIPDYMVPSFFIPLEQFPMTLNGKVDRKKLPIPSLDDMDKKIVQPETELEKKVASIWGQVLGYSNISLEDDFFEQGGESLLATRLISMLRKQFEIELPIRTLFETSKLEALIEAIKVESDFQEDDELQDLLEQLDELSPDELEKVLKSQS